MWHCTFSMAGLLILHSYVIITTGQKLRPRIGLNLKAQAVVKIFTQVAEKARELQQGI